MEFTKKERLILINQYRILEKLDPDTADHYQKQQKILENGYSLHYDGLIEFVSDELPEADCLEVIRTLKMYEVIQDSYKRLTDKGGVKQFAIEFPGYHDDPEECYYLGYVAFLVECDRFQHVVKKGKYRALGPFRKTYKKMLALYEQLGSPELLAKEQIIALTTVNDND